MSKRFLMTFVVCAILAASAGAADWPQWRGLQRDGLSPEKGLLVPWPAAGPKMLWKTQGLGEGYSSFAVADGRLYTQGQRGSQAYLIALDVGSGNKVWETAVGAAFHESRGNGPRGTPTVDGDRIYAVAGDGSILCADLKTGKRVWGFNAVREFGGRVPNWGISESPLIDGSRVIVTPGGSGAAVVALDKKTGAVVWKSGLSDSAAYSSPVLATIDGVRQIIVFTANGVAGIQADNGAPLWRYDRVANRVANIATPIVRENYVFVSSDYGTGCALLKISRVGGSWRASEEYFNKEMRNHYSTSVLVGDTLYGFSSAVLTAMNFRTGQVAWKDRSVGKGQITYADGHLYLLSEDGVVGLAEANPAAYREKSRFTISRGQYPTWTPPVISNGRMYLREQDNLYCYEVKGK